tara:strand:- start:866 stop:1525 length:660 start_codon:yes stop_codon:yes gene_type:complete
MGKKFTYNLDLLHFGLVGKELSNKKDFNKKIRKLRKYLSWGRIDGIPKLKDTKKGIQKRPTYAFKKIKENLTEDFDDQKDYFEVYFIMPLFEEIFGSLKDGDLEFKEKIKKTTDYPLEICIDAYELFMIEIKNVLRDNAWYGKVNQKNNRFDFKCKLWTLNLYGRNYSLEAALKSTLQVVLNATKNQKLWFLLIHKIENDQNLSKKEKQELIRKAKLDF